MDSCIALMLVLTGLPTLTTKLVEAQTYSERMFHTLFLKRLENADAREAILRPVNDGKCPITFSDPTVSAIVERTAGYPYFIQFFCREVFDVWTAKDAEGEVPSVPIPDITRKLDADFFPWSVGARNGPSARAFASCRDTAKCRPGVYGAGGCWIVA